jgi:hypothetical protein
MERSTVIRAGVPVAVVAGALAVTTYGFAGTNVSHTTIDRSWAKVDGHPAVEKGIVEARVQGSYHPLPWLGKKISAVSCPTGLKAVPGAKETCTAKAGGEQVSIPVSVVEVSGDPATPKVTWKYER